MVDRGNGRAQQAAHLTEHRGAGEGSRPSSPVAPDGPMFTPPGDVRCGAVKDACSCSLPPGHDGLHRCPHGWWRETPTSHHMNGKS